MINQGQVDRATAMLNPAKAVVLVTGAGVSKESGIPTYREPQTGLWSRYDPEELGTPEGFAKNPKLVWDWNEYRRLAMLEAKPNPGHIAIAELETLIPQVTVLTQNIDGLHQRAGSMNVVELHGSIHRQKCSANCRGNPTHLDLVTIDQHSPEGLPICPYCGAYLRPDIVWFHERLADDSLARSYEALRAAQVVVIIGTSGAVWPVAGFPNYAQEQNGAQVIEINPMKSLHTNKVDLHIAAPSGEAMPAIVSSLKQIRSRKG